MRPEVGLVRSDGSGPHGGAAFDGLLDDLADDFVERGAGKIGRVAAKGCQIGGVRFALVFDRGQYSQSGFQHFFTEYQDGSILLLRSGSVHQATAAPRTVTYFIVRLTPTLKCVIIHLDE